MLVTVLREFHCPLLSQLWQTLRELGKERAVEFAQHGHQHLRVPGTSPSEFKGLPLDEQAEKIRRGQEVLRREGIATPIWMAPYHSFDRATLQALVQRGFRFVSDGNGLYPVEQGGLVF